MTTMMILTVLLLLVVIQVLLIEATLKEKCIHGTSSSTPSSLYFSALDDEWCSS
jgi:hypothetical protein